MMQHLEPESLSAYLDGELDPRERSQVEQHLQSCAECSGVRNKLASVTGELSALPPVRVTVDEHRTLRQAVLDARPASSRPWGMAWVQWALAGGLVIAAVAVLSISFFGNGSPERGDEALTEAAAPSAAGFNFTNRNQVDETVAALPEVLAGLGRYRAEDAGSSAARNSAKAPAGQPAPMARSDTPSDGEQFSAPAPAPPPGSGSGAEGAQEDLTMLEDNESTFTFSNAAADACLERVAATQHYPMVPLLARQATLEGRQAWLLVFAWTAESDANAPLDRSQTWLVTPEDCRNLSGPELESKALYRSFSAPA